MDPNAPQWSSAKTRARSWKVDQLLDVLVEESAPALSPWYVTMDQVAQRGGLSQPPKRDAVIAALRAEGFAAARSHAEPRGVKTDASFAEVVRVAQALEGAC